MAHLPCSFEMPSDLSNETFPILWQANSLVIQMPEFFTRNAQKTVAFTETVEKIQQNSGLPAKIILDFRATQFMDSSGIGALMVVNRLLKSSASVLTLCNLGEQPLEVIDMVGLGNIVTIEQENGAVEQENLADSLPPSSQFEGRVAKPVSIVQPVLVATQTYHPAVRSLPKRLLDIVGATFGLLITGLLFVPIAIAIQLDDPGPIFFSQTRCGWMGRRFKIWKFRSMVVNAEALKSKITNEAEGAFFKNRHDPRITRVGRLLRKTSLDEFPQFWNVLKGDMSLVGTRPPTIDELERYAVPQWQRLDVKPGITGEWQVSGRSSVRKFEDVIQLDLRYQQRWSFWYDIQLILKTILVLLWKTEDAY